MTILTEYEYLLRHTDMTNPEALQKLLSEAQKEIANLKQSFIRRERFIVDKGLWNEFVKSMREPAQ